MSVRAKVIALLLGLLVFLVSAGSVGIAVRARAEQALSRVTQRDVPLLALSTRVTAVHLEQALRLERAQRAAERNDSHGREELLATRRAFESDAASIWNRLQDAVAFAESAARAGDPDARHRLEGVMRIDQAHNEYAERAREAFDSIASGDRLEAEAAVGRAEEAKVALGVVLGEVLEDSARSAADASSLARRDSEIARVVLWVLMFLGLAAAAGVFAMVFRLVSDMRTLTGLLPMCAWCKKIRDDQGYWNQLESYLQQNSDAQLTHGLCQECQCEMHAKLERSSEAPATA